MGEVFNDDSILDTVLEGLTDDYVQIKYSAGADDDFSLDHAGILPCVTRMQIETCATGLRAKRRGVSQPW